jgi:ketosteroid isomerase-like protein
MKERVSGSLPLARPLGVPLRSPAAASPRQARSRGGGRTQRTMRPALALLLAAVALPSLSCARRAASAVDERAAVKASLDRFFDAAGRQDWRAAAGEMTEDFEIFTDGAKPYGKREYVALLEKDNIQMGPYELRDLRIGVSGELAWMSYRGRFEPPAGGTGGRTDTAETLLFRRVDGVWRMFRAQAAVAPAAGDGR